jgi:hypothetical protein
VEKYRSCLGYRKISVTIKSFINEYGTITNLPREGRPPKLGPDKEGINQRGIKETKDNPEGAAKLHSGDLEYLSIGPLEAVHSRVGLYGSGPWVAGKVEVL